MMKYSILVLVLSLGVIPASLAPGQSTSWGVVQHSILNQNCTSCHAAGTSFAVQSDLVLTEEVAYGQLVDELPRNTAARADGLKRVSSAGGHAGLHQSFLWEKINAPEQDHFYDDHPNYGAIMPLGGLPLTNGELEFVKCWIMEGAPQTGTPCDEALLNDTTRYEPAEFVPLDPPEHGVQFHLGPYEVWPSETHDREFLYYQPYPTTEDRLIDRFEISYRPGSHHFILFNYPEGRPTPEPEVYRDLRDQQGVPDPAVELERAVLFPFYLFVGAQTPNVDYHLPPGVALRWPAGSGFDLNSHYVNRTGTTQMGEVYVNLHTVDSDAIEHVADYKNFGNFDIVLPPNQITTLSKTFTFTETTHIIQLASHAHEHMLEFRIEGVGGDHDGDLLYWANDWEHPPLLELDPPLTFREGDQVRLETTYDNWTDETITFGLLSSDEMQFMFYVAYVTDPIPFDFNADGTVDVTDIDMLIVEIVAGTNQESFDLSGEGVVDETDLRQWLSNAAIHNGFNEAYLPGDTNLDGSVDSVDLNNLALKWQQDVANWSSGDITADGRVNSADLNAIGINWRKSIPVATSADATVPEPSAWLLTVIGFALVFRKPRCN